MPDPSTNGQWIHDALERFEAPLCRYAAGMLNDSERARDAVQDTFLRLVRTPPPAEVRRDESRFRGWLFTVCRRRTLDIRRKERRMSLMTAGQAAALAQPAAAPSAEAADEHARILAALADLPDNQRECLRLKFQGGLKYREIAEVTGLTTGNVGYLIHHGLKTLRQRLQ